MASNVIIEDLSGEDGDVLCITGDAFLVHVQDMQITKTDVIDALLSIDDGLTQTWIVDSRASFHVTWNALPHLMRAVIEKFNLVIIMLAILMVLAP